MKTGTLIVGASQAGIQLAASLRENGYDDPISLVGAEEHRPYARPPLSKAFLAGKADMDSLELRSPAFYAEKRIDVMTAQRVISVRLSSGIDGAGTAVTESGQRIEFDKLALTVGARPRRLTLPGAELNGVCYLRVVEDAEVLRAALTKARRVVVIGGGFVGLEAAAVARSEGKAVTVVEAADRLIPRSVAPVMSEFLLRVHQDRGTEVHLGSQATQIVGEGGQVSAVELADGTRLEADLVVVGVGITARTELAEQLGLQCDDGIVVDEYARTSNPSVVAAGDCTVLSNPLTGQGRFRLESTQNAINQAQTAAATLVGILKPYRSVPWFWSDQYDLKLQIAGLTHGYDAHVVRGDPGSGKFSVLYYRQGQLLAIDAVNHPADYLTVRAALGRGATIPADQAADSSIALKSLMSGPAVTAASAS